MLGAGDNTGGDLYNPGEEQPDYEAIAQAYYEQPEERLAYMVDRGVDVIEWNSFVEWVYEQEIKRREL